VTINRYLTDALIRYMERKELQVITRAAAVEVVRSVDERYVSGFTPLSWAQLIDPLFQISRNRVDSELIHDFFVDKDRDELANLFPETSSRMERVQLIERLTVGHAPKKATKEQTKSQPVESHDEVELISEPPIIEPPAVVMEPEPDKEPSTLLSSLSDELEASEPEVSPSFAVNTEETPSATVVPIWQQFLNDVPDEADDVPDDVVTPPFAESLFEAEPQAAATVASSLHSVGLQKAKLVDWLKTDENAYIEDLFNGNEMEYFRTVAELEACSDWDGVQSILKGWVRSSDIDLHNAQLAQLVDQLQIYFSTNDS
jgi:hypothetical protein